MPKPQYFEEYLNTGAPQYLLHFPARGVPGDGVPGGGVPGDGVPRDGVPARGVPGDGVREERDADPAPVVLFVHGGPGFSETFLGYRVKKLLGEAATLVFWDQRGAGKSLAASPWPVPYSITIEDVRRDMEAVVAHLKQRYRRDKIIVMGHSWGSILGSLHAIVHPDDLLVYIAIGQVVEMAENERRAWVELRSRITQAGNKKDLAALPTWESLNYPPGPGKPPPNWVVFNRLRRKYEMVVRLGPRDVLTFLRNPVFAWSDFSFLRSKVEPLRWDLVRYLEGFDLRREGFDYQVPVAYILGELDTTASASLAVEYFEELRAPAKLLTLIPDAGHNPISEAPTAFAAAFHQALGLIGEP
ncbi:MAG: alpha/beta hydrolase [Bifidobacteriaceae bacterium]|jgi:pimeloyl-ACP methyl ester carboxylesterase|nr:alpha/beta hydrolase [Bifidobacteriaceae bacterium]